MHDFWLTRRGAPSVTEKPKQETTTTTKTPRNYAREKGVTTRQSFFIFWFLSEEKEKLSNQNQNQMRVVVLCVFLKKKRSALLSSLVGKKIRVKNRHFSLYFSRSV